MPFATRHPRLFSTALYCAAMVTFLTLIYGDDWFCARDGRSIIPALIKICVSVFALDQCASFAGMGIWRGALQGSKPGIIGVLFATAIVAVVLIPLPYVVYEGYGHIRFEGTPFDYGCFVTEGYGMMFPMITGPVLALMTLVREAYLDMLLKRSAA